MATSVMRSVMQSIVAVQCRVLCRFVASLMPAYFSYYDRVGRKLQSKEISDSFYKPFEMWVASTLGFFEPAQQD